MTAAERKTDAMAPLPTHVIHWNGEHIYVEFRPLGDQSRGRTGVYYNNEDEMEREGHPPRWSVRHGDTLRSGQIPHPGVYVETVAEYHKAESKRGFAAASPPRVRP